MLNIVFLEPGMILTLVKFKVLMVLSSMDALLIESLLEASAFFILSA